MSYLSVAEPHLREKVIEKSRFLTYVRHTPDEESARAFLLQVRSEHPLATHVCYAFVADRIGNVMRFSDDGEPQGTAGMPILGVLRARKLYETSVAVVRYFGGIKLGAGGLTRAYSSCAAEALEQARVCEYAVCVEVTLSVAYPEINPLTRFLEDKNVLSREFSERACFVVAVREEDVDAFCAKCADLLSGRVEILRGKSYFAPFSLDC